MEQTAAQWVGTVMLRVAIGLATAAVLALPVTSLVMIPMLVGDIPYPEPNPAAIVLPCAVFSACVAAVLFVIVGIRRGEQRRMWDDFVAGRPARPPRAAWMIAIVTVGLVAPVAAFLLIRVPRGCSVLNLFGLPWPDDVTTVILVSSGAVVLVASVLALSGLAVSTVRSASVAILWYWVAMLVPGFFVLFLSLYGDPGPTTCQ